MIILEAYENWTIQPSIHPPNKLLLITYNMPDIVLELGMIKIWIF